MRQSIFIAFIVLAFTGRTAESEPTGTSPHVHPMGIPENATHSPKSLSIGLIQNCNSKCECHDARDCNPKITTVAYYHAKDPSNVTHPIVVMMSNGSNIFKHWKWQHISIVLSVGQYSWSHYDHWDLLCYSHSAGKLYGYVEKIHLTTDGQSPFRSYQTLDDYIKNDLNHLLCGYTSAIALDFLKLFETPPEGFTIEKLSYLIATVKLTLQHKLPRESLHCIMPWLPCANIDQKSQCDSQTPAQISEKCRGLMKTLAAYCDYIVINPESFLWQNKHDCRARPEVPMMQLAYSVDKYTSMGLEAKKIIIGVPWHGMDHTCASYDSKTNICQYKTSNKTECEVTRQEKSLWDEPNHHFRWSDMFQAAYYIYTKNQMKHQVWLEDWKSHSMKYKFARDFGLGGVSIWTGDDVHYQETDVDLKAFDESMWNYLSTGLYPVHRKSTPRSYENIAGHMAGTAVGCLLAGALLGALFTYCGLVRGRRISLRPPFRKDTEQFMDEPDM